MKALPKAMSKLNAIHEQRLALILKNLNLLDHDNTPTLTEFVEMESLPEKLRAAVLFLSVRAKYPNQQNITLISDWLRYSHFHFAIDYVLSGASRSDLIRELRPATPHLTDVTRYSSSPEMSGIPRVVKHFITSDAMANGSLGVWANGIFAPVELDNNAQVQFKKEIWGNFIRRRVYWHLRNLFVSHSSKWAGSIVYKAFVYIVTKLQVTRFLIKNLDLVSPNTCYLIDPKNFILVEVPSGGNSERLRVWSESIGINFNRVFVHDLLPLTHPEFFDADVFYEHLAYVDLLKSFDSLIVATPILQREFDNLLEDTTLSSRTKVLPLPVSLPGGKTNTTGQLRKNFVFVGGYQKRKGLAQLVELLDHFDDSQITFTITVVGTPNTLRDPDEGKLYYKIKKRSNVFKVTSPLSDNDLATLIVNSTGVLYLSEAEGYGLPILEALSLNKIAIVLDNDLNRYFKQMYGGIHLLETPFSTVTLDELTEIAHQGNLFTETISNLRHSALPLDIAHWARELVSL